VSEDSNAAGGSTATINDGSGSGSGTGRHRAFGIEQQFIKYILRSVTVSVHMCNMYTYIAVSFAVALTVLTCIRQQRLMRILHR
jgi:hypothetical protein